MKESRALKESVREIIVSAPATVANVAVGFDILGFAIEGPGDTVTLTRTADPGVRIISIAPELGLSLDPAKNTATAGLLRAISDLALPGGFEVGIKKGIALSSGMGGSAASAVASLCALNGFLNEPLSNSQLLKYCVDGESVASGSRHADNVAPCLMGGMQLVRSLEPMDVVSIPVPARLWCALVHPELKIETKAARGILRQSLGLSEHIEASANLAATISACHRDDLELLKRSLQDKIIEPQRAQLIPGFDAVKNAALSTGAIGCSISGAGPSIFAWAEGESSARTIMSSMLEAFKGAGVRAEGWTSPVGAQGARIVRKS